MKVYKFTKAYSEKGNTNFRFTNEKSGVYIIKELGKIVYVGLSATNLYRTMYRHFQRWSDVEYKAGKAIPAQYRVSYKNKKLSNYTIRVILCTAGQAERLEKALILKHKPRDNWNKYEQYILNFTEKETAEIYTSSPIIQEVPF